MQRAAYPGISDETVTVTFELLGFMARPSIRQQVPLLLKSMPTSLTDLRSTLEMLTKVTPPPTRNRTSQRTGPATSAFPGEKYYFDNPTTTATDRRTDAYLRDSYDEVVRVYTDNHIAESIRSKMQQATGVSRVIHVCRNR